MGSERIAGCTLDLPTDTLSAWRDRALPVGEAEQMGAHLSECAACRARLAEYDVVARTLRTLAVPEPVRGYGRNPRRWDVTSAGDSERPNFPARPHVVGPARSRDGSRPRPPMAVEVIAALLLVSLLGGLLGWERHAGAGSRISTATPTLTLDPVTQAYVHVLWTDYPPFVDAEQREWEQCAVPITNHSPPQLLAPCRPLELAAITAAQALLDHLATTPSPTRWQAQDAALKRAVRAAIAYNTERIHYIDANNVLRFYLTRDDGNAAGSLLCTTLVQIDDGPPPLVPGIPPPDYGLDPGGSGCLPV